jgi:hypothetical protein
MGELVFTQQCLSKLVKIRREMEKEFGYNYQLSSNNNLVDLLLAAAYSPDEEIQQCFRDFLQGLSKQQLKIITDLGVSLPADFAR